MTGETPGELADAYAEALESRADGDDYEDAREHLDALRSRLERFEESYGDSDPATVELSERVQAAEDEMSALEQQRRKPEELERELLEAARGFMMDDEWLQADVIQALNRALVGTPHGTLRVDDFEISGPGDAEELDDVTRFDAIDVIRMLVLDKLGETDDVRQVWGSIEGTTKEGAFRVVAEAGEATPGDVVAGLDEDIDRETANTRLRNSVHQLDINPYHRDDGTFSLSTAGRYIAVEYAGADNSDEEQSSDGDVASNGQTTLEDGSVEVRGGGSDG